MRSVDLGLTPVLFYFLKKKHTVNYAKNSITVTSLYVETILLRPSLSHRVYPTLL